MQIPIADGAQYSGVLLGVLAFFEKVQPVFRSSYMGYVIGFTLALLLSLWVWRVVRGGWR